MIFRSSMSPVDANDLSAHEPQRAPGKLLQRRLPPLAAATVSIEAFETRLALSANPGAELIVSALSEIQDGFCSPADIREVEFRQAVLTPEFSELSGLSTQTSSLLQQAADIRSTYNLTGAGQTVAIIDSGIAWDHVALGRGFGPGYRVVGGWDFAENDSNPYDDAPAGFHGSHVTGIIGGDGTGANLPGIAPGADLVGLRVFTDFGRSSLDWVESALQWVYNNRNAFEFPITTVNMSLGASMPSGFSPDAQGQLQDELELLRSSGIVVVAAAGNQFDVRTPDNLSYPASSSLTWAVASTDTNGNLSSFSQRNPSILAAPGERIFSTVPDHLLGRDGLVNDYHTASGTSMAAPQVAGASMLVRQALEQAGRETSPDIIHQILTTTSDRHFDSITGFEYHSINLSNAIASILGPSDEQTGTGNPTSGGSGNAADNVSWNQPRDLGIVRWDQVELGFGNGVRVIAAQEGLFSIRSEQAETNPVVRVTDGAGQTLWNAKLPDNGQLDIPVDSGQSLVIHAADAVLRTPATLNFANVFDFAEGHVQVKLGAANPAVVLDLQNGFNAAVGEFQYAIGAGQVRTGVVDGGSGPDRLEVRGSSANTHITLSPYTDGSLSEGNLQLTLRDFEDVTFIGGGGSNRANLFDTRGDDVLTARPGYAKLEGVGFRYEVSDIQRSFVHATAGGQDVAFLHDSAGNDHLAVRPQFVSLRGSGFFSSAIGFEKVYAYSTSGGADRADLYDSSGNDQLFASASSALITSSGYFVQARGFSSVTAHSTAGGFDTASLYSDDPANSRWIRTSDQLALRVADGSERIARGFDVVQPFEAGVQVNVPRANWIALGQSPEPQPQSLDSESPVSKVAFMDQLRRRERIVLDDLFGQFGAAD